jgi:UDP-N-acetyl-D-glucosamine dehydrogenase
MTSLADKISNKSAVVGVIGQGYIGLPPALVFWEAGFRVIGFDVDKKKIEILSTGESYIKHVGPQ